MSENQQSSPENDKSKTTKSPRKRQVHNEVERRRKDKINGWIMKISELLPNKELHKTSKISILEQTVSYIKGLVTERDKLLTEHCADILEKEVNALKKKIIFLEEQNSLYAKLLQQAKISLTSLPKKVPKYSNKFTEGRRAILLKKLNSAPQSLGPTLLPNNVVQVSNGCSSPTLKPSSQSTVTVSASTSTSCTTINSSIVTQSTIVQNPEDQTKKQSTVLQEKKKISHVTQNPVLQNNNEVQCVVSPNHISLVTVACCQSAALSFSVSHLNELKTNSSSVITVPSCTLETRTMLNAGGVTSALSPFPVMSSTLGSSFGNVYSRSIPTVIILPTGGGFVQPSLLSSNISVISPAVDNVLPILVPQPSHNVPTTSVNILGPSSLNSIVNGISNNPHTILSLPITVDKNSADHSLTQSSHCKNVDVASSDVNMVETIPSIVEPLPLKIPVSLQETVVEKSTTNMVSDNETVSSPYNQSITEKKASSPVLENSDCALSNSAHSTNCAIDPKTSLEKKTEITNKNNENSKSANVINSPADSSSDLQVKKYPRNVPPSLQALSANRIISLANKLQVQTYQTSLTSNNKVSVENGSILCVDSVSLKEKQGNIGNTEKSPKVPPLQNKSPLATTVSPTEKIVKPVENVKVCQNISQVYDKNSNNSKAVDMQGINLSPVGPFPLEECGANSFQMHSPKSSSTLSCFSDNTQSDPKSMLPQVSSDDSSKSVSLKPSDKSVTAANDITNKISDNLSPLVTKAHTVPNVNTTNTSNITQASLWSNSLLNIPTNQSSSKKQRDDLLQFDIPDGAHQEIVNSNISINTEPLNQTVKHSTNAASSQIKNTENSTICQFTNISKPSCVMTTEALLYQNSRPDISVGNNHLCIHASQGSTIVNDDNRNKFITSSGINNMKVYVTSAATSVCSSSMQFSEAVVPNSHPYSNVTYINNIVTPSNSKAMSHPNVSWSNPASITCNTVGIVSTKEMEQNSYTFSSVQGYPSNVPINSLEAESTSSTYGLEKPKEKASGQKGRSKPVKKSKSLPGISSNTFNILPEVVSNIENFVTGTCDVFQPTQDEAPHQRISQHHNLMQKTDQLNSDILAKAAECILGHEAFHSMEISSEEPSSQRSITPYDATTSFSNSDVFNQIFTASDTSKNPNCYAVTKFNDDRFQALDSSKVKTLVPDKMHYGVVHLSDNVTTYENHSGIYTRVRKTNCNSEDEPQAKKAKENLTVDAIISSSAPTPIYSTVSSNLRSQEHNKPVERADDKHPAMGTSAVSMQSKNNTECLPTQEVTFYELTKKQNFSEVKNNMLSQNSLSNSKLSHLPSPVVSQAVCGPISHPVNNLFTDSVSSTCSKNNNVKTPILQNLSDNNKNNPTSNYVGGNNTIGQSVSYSSSKELTALKSSNMTTSESMLPHFLSHSSAMGFSALQNSSHQAMSSTNHFELFNTHASTIASVPQTKLQVNSLSHLPLQPSQQSLPLNSASQSRDTTGRILTSLSSNLPANSNSAEVQSKTCLQSPVTTTSLSHSLCSLLKETPSNTLTSSVTGTPCSTSSPLDINVSVSSGVSKYSALSLISNQSCLASKSVTISKSNSNVLPSNTTPISCSTSLAAASVCNKNSKTSLSYSAERLIQNQCTQVDKDRGKTTSNIIPSKTLESGFYKSNNYIPMVNSEMNVQSLPRMPLPPATSFPTFPSSFPVCDVRPPVDMHAGVQYQDISQTAPKDMFSQASNFNLSSQAQRNPCTTQNISGASLPKSHAGLAINFDNSGTMYNSCNFLQHSMPNVESGKSSESNACFPPIFVNSNYSQPPPPKKNCCHFANQMPSQVGDATTDKNFPVMPPIAPFPDKSIIHDSRPIQDSSMTQNASSYVSNIFYEPTSCTHESIGGSKPSIQRASQETYVPHRTKQGITAQTPCIPSPLKTLSQNKGKTRKSKHNAASDLNRTAVFNPNNCMNFNVFTVPDLSCGKSNLHHVPNNYAKNAAQSVIPSISDMQTQQGKISESLLSSVMSPHHAPFNSTLHQQNDLLNLNFQTANYSGTPLTMHPPLTLSTCSTTPKTSRSFPSVPNPVPNFNLSNILPDMGCSSSDISFSPIKFPPDCQPSSSSASSMLSASHQTGTSSLYTPHPSVVPNALPPLLNHTPHTLNRTRAPLPASASIPTIPQSSHFTSSQAQPFQNIIHSLNFARPDRQN